MQTRMFYTKERHIPVFMVIIPDGDGETLVDFQNPRTKVHETMPLRELIQELNQMAFSR